MRNRKESDKKYRERPDIKEKQRLYMIDYRAKNKERRKEYDAIHNEHINTLRRKNYEERKDIILKQNRAWRDAQKDGYYYVYYLPEEHYVGMTNDVKRRIRQHNHYDRKRKALKITEGYEVIARFERAVDAHMFETMMHQRGYNGFKM